MSDKLDLIIRPTRCDGVDHPESEFGTLSIFIQSKDLENFFLSICPDRDTIKKNRSRIIKNEEYSPEVCDVLHKGVTEKGEKIHLMRVNKPIVGMTGKPTDDFTLTDFTTPNMRILTAVGLGDGIEFIFGGLYTNQTVNSTLKNMYDRSKQIYASYIEKLKFASV